MIEGKFSDEVVVHEEKTDININEKYDPDKRVESYDGYNDSESFDPDKRVEYGHYEENQDEYNPDDRIVKKTLTSFDSVHTNNAQVEKNNMDNVRSEETHQSHKEKIDGKTYYYDDNGNLYRVDTDLLPNATYEINGYKYQTDDQGRIISAEGNLHIKTHEGKLRIRDSIEDIGKGDQKEGDDRGHLIGDQFDGSNGLENLIPQDATVNQKDFHNFENELAQCVKDGKEVTVKVEPIYDDDSRRPSAIVVTYSIDGEESVRVFPNGTEE